MVVATEVVEFCVARLICASWSICQGDERPEAPEGPTQRLPASCTLGRASGCPCGRIGSPRKIRTPTSHFISIPTGVTTPV